MSFSIILLFFIISTLQTLARVIPEVTGQHFNILQSIIRFSVRIPIVDLQINALHASSAFLENRKI